MINFQKNEMKRFINTFYFMSRKIILLGVVLLVAGQLAAQTTFLVTVKADGSKTQYALSDVQKIVFSDNAMTVSMASGSDVSDVTCVRFTDQQSGIETLKKEGRIFVFPNPVQTFLTVSGVDKDTKINLLNLNGALLQSIPALDNSTNVNVSSLQQGIYLLQIGEQTVKFIKQ